jgi:hypothetical protein
MSREFKAEKMVFILKSGKYFRKENGKQKKYIAGSTILSDIDLDAKFPKMFQKVEGVTASSAKPSKGIAIGESTKEKKQREEEEAAERKESGPEIQKGSIEADDITEEDEEAIEEEQPKRTSRKRTRKPAGAAKAKKEVKTEKKKKTIIDNGGEYYAKERALAGKGRWDVYNRKTKKKLNAKDAPLTEVEALDIIASGDVGSLKG